jgi:hypothetical protein
MFLQKAIILHIRILWGLLNPKQVPGDPPSDILSVFAARFSTDTAIYNCQDGPVLVSPSLVNIGMSVASNFSSRVASQVRQVEEHMLEYMQASLTRFGLMLNDMVSRPPPDGLLTLQFCLPDHHTRYIQAGTCCTHLHSSPAKYLIRQGHVTPCQII